MKRIVVVIPHSHAWFWVQTCVASLIRNPPVAKGYEVQIVVVDSSPWSPSIRGIKETSLSKHVTVIDNCRSNPFHATALDWVIVQADLDANSNKITTENPCNHCKGMITHIPTCQKYKTPYVEYFDLMVALETDVLALRPGWLQWFVDQLRDTDYAVGAWHHESFINPSCTLYRGNVLRDMFKWCRDIKEKHSLRWGVQFNTRSPLDQNYPPDMVEVFDNMVSWMCGPFAEKRGWPAGTVLKEEPSGQLKGPGWYEPGQMLHHWAVQEGYTYTICPTLTTTRYDNLPLQTLYGASMPDPQRQLEAVEMFGNAETVHLWGGTRALDIIKHDVTCQFVKGNTPFWLAREARFWKQVVPEDVQAQTLELIRKHGWHITGQGSNHVSDRDRAAAEYVRECYKQGGVEW